MAHGVVPPGVHWHQLSDKCGQESISAAYAVWRRSGIAGEVGRNARHCEVVHSQHPGTAISQQLKSFMRGVAMRMTSGRVSIPRARIGSFAGVAATGVRGQRGVCVRTPAAGGTKNGGSQRSGGRTRARGGLRSALMFRHTSQAQARRLIGSHWTWTRFLSAQRGFGSLLGDPLDA
jgi:hypothetical protein